MNMTSSASKELTTVKAEEKKRRTVFRQLLDSPYNIIWKSVDQKTGDDILEILLTLLEPLKIHRPQSQNGSRKRKRASSSDGSQQPLFIDPPPLASYLTIGFNSTTEHLEQELKQDTSQKHMRVILVARGDTNFSHLYAHFPLMVSMLPHIRLVSFPKGAEALLCGALKLKRVGVIGIMDGAPGAEQLFQLVEDRVPKIECPWNKDGETAFVPTKVKWIQTLANTKKDKKDTQAKTDTAE